MVIGCRALPKSEDLGRPPSGTKQAVRHHDLGNQEIEGVLFRGVEIHVGALIIRIGPWDLSSKSITRNPKEQYRQSII